MFSYHYFSYPCGYKQEIFSFLYTTFNIIFSCEYMGKSSKPLIIFVVIFLEQFIAVIQAPWEAREPD